MSVKGLLDSRKYLFQSTPLAGTDTDHRNFQFLGEKFEIDRDLFLFGFIQKIDTENNRDFCGQNLQYQIQVAFQTGGIADRDHRVRMSCTDEISGNFLLF